MTEDGQKLEMLRKEIFEADNGVLSALAKRMGIVEKIGQYKRSHGMEPFDASLRNQRKQSWIERGTRLGLSYDFVGKIYEFVHDHSVELEREKHQ